MLFKKCICFETTKVFGSSLYIFPGSKHIIFSLYIIKNTKIRHAAFENISLPAQSINAYQKILKKNSLSLISHQSYRVLTILLQDKN